MFLAYKAQTLSVKQSSVWSFPVLQDLSGNILQLSYKAVKELYCVIDDGISIVVWKGMSYL